MATQKIAHSADFEATDWTQWAPVKGISLLFNTFNAGLSASHDFQTLAGMSDAALAERGLVREEIARKVFETHFGK